jgi:hypothetical protein
MSVVGFVKRIVVDLRVLEKLSLEQKNPLADSVCFGFSHQTLQCGYSKFQ